MTTRQLLPKILGALVAIPIVALALLLASLRLEHTFSTTLPTPTGALPVGRLIVTWRDDAIDSLAPAPGVKRELLVWIWYPSGPGELPGKAARYRPIPIGAATELAHRPGSVLGSLMSDFLTRDQGKVRTHSNDDAVLSPSERSYPVVIMRAGASAEVANYSTLAEDLASHGYVVVGFDAPYRTGLVVFPDGRVIRRTPENNPELAFGSPDSARRIGRLLAAWTSDVGFVLDRLRRLNSEEDSSSQFVGRLDLSRVGVFGHSFGGATAIQFCHDDSRCQAGVDVDGAPLGRAIGAGLDRPFMFLLSDHRDSASSEGRRIRADIQSIYDRSPPDRRVRIAIRGANHFLFSDDGALLKSHLLLWLLRRLGVVGIGGPRQLAITAYCLRTFFDRHLKGIGDASFPIASPLYPEIRTIE